MKANSQLALHTAIADFHSSRRKAKLEAVLNRLTGRSSDLLKYEELRRQFRGGSSVERGLHNIPIDAIVGSVGRYYDFTRSFLPRQDSDEQRWARVKVGVSDLSGLPPVELYRLGDTYFVLDGHHRISVAREIGATHIEAYVKEVQIRVKLEPDDKPEQIILKSELAQFLVETEFDSILPEVELKVTAPGKYAVVKEHIEVHHYYMGIEQEREIGNEEAVRDWYEQVYLPVVQIIREKGLLLDFPTRTETDLYLWLAVYRSELEAELGWDVSTTVAVTDLAERRSLTPAKIWARVYSWLYDKLTPDVIEAGPKPGTWRAQMVPDHPETLFPTILTTISDRDHEMIALQQAIHIARKERGEVHGLYVRAEGEADPAQTEAEIQAAFDRCISGTGVNGRMVMDSGVISRVVCDRARWNHLVVLHAAFPPGDTAADRFSSGLRIILHRCPRPVLFVSQTLSPMDRVMLAYNDSPKAQEALYIATYLAAAWDCTLHVLAIAERGALGFEWLDRARSYIEEHGVRAQYLHKIGPVPRVIHAAVLQTQSNLLIMGGYKAPPIQEVMLGSKVDELLRTSSEPILICN